MKLNNIDFLFIGPSKTASTWIFEMLNSHDEFSLPSSKDIYFFDKFFHKGVKWYIKQFANCDPNKIVGEFSHDYILKNHYVGGEVNVIERIKTKMPNVKLICCLRNPYDRSWSGINFLRRNGYLNGEWLDLINVHSELIEGSLYGKNIQNIKSHFNNDQLLILRFDELKTDPTIFLERIYDFLGVKEKKYSENIGKIYNQRSKAKIEWLAFLAKQLALFMRAIGYGTLVGRIKRNPTINKMIFLKVVKGLEPTEEFISHMSRYFEKDILLLEDLTNENFQHWNKRNG